MRQTEPNAECKGPPLAGSAGLKVMKAEVGRVRRERLWDRDGFVAGEWWERFGGEVGGVRRWLQRFGWRSGEVSEVRFVRLR